MQQTQDKTFITITLDQQIQIKGGDDQADILISDLGGI